MQREANAVYFVEKVEYLVFIISKDGVATDLAQIEAVVNWPQPKFVREARGFLGLTEWYRVFIVCYATIASPLTGILKKTKKFVGLLKLKKVSRLLSKLW